MDLHTGESHEVPHGGPQSVQVKGRRDKADDPLVGGGNSFGVLDRTRVDEITESVGWLVHQRGTISAS